MKLNTMHLEKVKNPSPINPESPEWMLRVSHELDRFRVKLMQIEWSVSQLIEAHSGELPGTTNTSLQNIDYVTQVSMALSILLTRIHAEPNAVIDDLFSEVMPNDLRERLHNRLLENIDNVKQNVEIF